MADNCSKMEYGELSTDTSFVNTCDQLKDNLRDVEKILDEWLPYKQYYDELKPEVQIDLDLFLAYTLNSLHWIHLRLDDVDLNNHPIKNELKRIKTAMLKWQEVKNRSKRPQLDIAAVKRFIKSGLYHPYKGITKVQGKKRKFAEIEN